MKTMHSPYNKTLVLFVLGLIGVGIYWQWSLWSVAKAVEQSERLVPSNIQHSDGVYSSGRSANVPRLPLGGSITGSVTDKNGQPVQGMEMLAYLGTPSNGSMFWSLVDGFYYSQADGHYTITELEAGTYRLEAKNRDPDRFPFIGKFYKDAYTLETATDIPVQAGQTVANINFQVATYGTIQGHVSNIEGQSLQGIRVAAEDVQSGMAMNSDITDDSGNYTLLFDHPVTVRIRFYEEEQLGPILGYATEYYNHSLTAEGATSVSIEPDKTISDINAQLSRRGGIAGSIVNTKGEPISQITVRLIKPANCCEDVYTWDKSTFEFTKLEAGVYHLCFDETPPHEYSGACYLDAQSEESATDIYVQPATTTQITMTLKRYGNINGTVISPYGTPIQMADVRLWQQASFGFVENGQARSDNNGYFHFDTLLPGTYYVGVPFVIGRTDFLAEYYDNKATIESSTPISVSLEEAIVVNFQLAFNPEINAPPYARNDAIWLTQVATGTQFTSSAISILANDQDYENASLQAMITVSPTHGTVALSTSGTFTYTHDSSKTVFDSFTYHVSDGNSDSNNATVFIILPGAKNVFLPAIQR